jgi:LCP family protein required for cell wall assembly
VFHKRSKQSHKSISERELRARSEHAASRHSAEHGAGRGRSAESLSRNASLGRYADTRKRRHRKSVLRGVLITFLCILLSGGVAVAAYMFNINSRLTQGVDSSLRSVLSEASFDQPFYMLLLGVDKDSVRESDSNYGESESSYRTDTIILARIDPVNKKVTLISIPRDTYVDMGEHGQQKINAAYSYGGAAYTVQVVEQLAGVDISHYASVDMDGFAAIVDAVGGVTVDLPVAVSDPDYTHLDLPAGEQTLDGETAALLARCRHGYDAYGGGDYYRAANQRMLIGAVVKKVLASDPATMASTISTAADYITTDFSVTDIINLASQFSGFDIDTDLYSGQCPTQSQYVDGLWIDVLQQDEWDAMMKRVDAGEPPYSDSSQDFTAGVAGSVGVSSESSSSSSSSDSSSDVALDGNVIVLNATSTQGLANEVCTKLEEAGFDAMADNASVKSDTTTIYYNGTQGQARANGVLQTLGGSYAIAENDGTYSTSVDVVVVLGSDYSAS